MMKERIVGLQSIRSRNEKNLREVLEEIDDPENFILDFYAIHDSNWLEALDEFLSTK